MWNRKLTFVLVPNAKGSTRQVTLSVASLWIAAVALVALLVVSFYFSANFFTQQVSSHELDRLRAENRELSDKFEKMRWSLAAVEDRYAELVDKEVLIRGVFDLPEINPQERQLGIGGPTPPAVEAMSPTQSVAYRTERELDRLLRLSEFEIEKYAEVESALEGLKDRLDHTPSIWPTKGWLSSSFGMRDDPMTGYRRMHYGIDISGHRGTPIVAPARGRISRVGKAGGLGLMITIDHGYGFQTRFGHLSKTDVKLGQAIERGYVIGRMGSSGYSTGVHLHYEVRRNGKALNPIGFILNEM